MLIGIKKGANMLVLETCAVSRMEIERTMIKLCECDNDMNGENGDESLWDEAKEAGFASNAEYLARFTMNALPLGTELTTPLIEELFDKFVQAWVGHDSYYLGYDVGVKSVGLNKIVVGLALFHED